MPHFVKGILRHLKPASLSDKVNTRYAEKKKKHKLFFLTKMTIPIKTGVLFGNKIHVLFGIHGIDFNLVFTSHKSSLFSGGIGVRAL